MTTLDEALALADECYEAGSVRYSRNDERLLRAAAAIRDLTTALSAAEADAAAARKRVRELEAERKVLDGETFAGVANVSGGLLRLTIIWDGASPFPVWFGSGPMLGLTEDERDAVKRLRAALARQGGRDA